jgi:hypothetical protein
MGYFCIIPTPGQFDRDQSFTRKECWIVALHHISKPWPVDSRLCSRIMAIIIKGAMVPEMPHPRC